MKVSSILIVMGAFKDVYTPVESTDLINNIIRDIFNNNIITFKIPMIDGGEYSSEVLIEYFNYKKVNLSGIIDPVGRKKKAYYVELDSNTAFIASSVILGLPPEAEKDKNPLYLTSYGYGQLLKDALDKGYKKVILGMGGTNTVDCGIGMSQALGVNFYDKNKKIVIPQNKKYYAGIDLERIYNISGDDLSQIFKNTEIEVVCDADITIKQMYIPINQKIGKYYDEEREKIIDFFKKNILKYSRVIENLFKSAKTYRDFLFNKLENSNYFGTAGGIALSLMARFNIKIGLGSEYFSKLFGLEKLIQQSDIVITGEGKFDNSLQGKTPIGVSRLAKKYNKPVVYLTGNVEDSLKKYFGSSYFSDALPQEFSDNGVDTIISCHPFYDSSKMSENYSEKINFYRKNNPIIFTEALKKYFEKTELI